MKVLDLFSGIGGFSLGLERAGLSTVAFCEIDPFCRSVLRSRFPCTPIYANVRSLTAAQLRHDGIKQVDVICGGFPCQPFSHASAGKRRGTEDDRYLWPEMCRLIDDLRPSWVCGENVAGIDRLALDQVVSDLEAVGYEVAVLEIPACAVGHDHRRLRFWILGHSDGYSKSSSAVNAEASGMSRHNRLAGGMGEAHGVSGKLDRARLIAIGNSVVPQIPEMIGLAIMSAEAAASAAKGAA